MKKDLCNEYVTVKPNDIDKFPILYDVFGTTAYFECNIYKNNTSEFNLKSSSYTDQYYYNLGLSSA